MTPVSNVLVSTNSRTLRSSLFSKSRLPFPKTRGWTISLSSPSCLALLHGNPPVQLATPLQRPEYRGHRHEPVARPPARSRCNAALLCATEPPRQDRQQVRQLGL